MNISRLFQTPVFWIAIILMVCAGASELSMAQWASAYTESALGLSKAIGDLAGPCIFAIMMGISRVIFGKYGHRLDLMQFMIRSAFALNGFQAAELPCSACLLWPVTWAGHSDRD